MVKKKKLISLMKTKIFEKFSNDIVLFLLGWLYDITGSYDWSFYLAGFFIALSGTMLMVMPLLDMFRRCSCTKRKDVPGQFSDINSV